MHRVVEITFVADFHRLFENGLICMRLFSSLKRPLIHVSFHDIPLADELEVDTAKLDSPDAAYLGRGEKIPQKYLVDIFRF